MLVIDCCIRGEESATRTYYEAYLETLPASTPVEIVKLAEEALTPLSAEDVRRRDRGDFDDAFFRYARQFREADEILIAAPFWDLSFPSLLKVYLEQVCVTGLTFGYEDGACVGYCKAKRLLYFSTCGGFVGENHLGFEYVKAVAAMLGIHSCVPYVIEGMDIDPSRREQILQEKIAEL
ncbi:MAG: NAD(P)H-dependent oxidoreductase [Eubacteriales bacterium]|nr:NAD(P)H-dependent oxidoreductase [Eubacteriales bacterium]